MSNYVFQYIIKILNIINNYDINQLCQKTDYLINLTLI